MYTPQLFLYGSIDYFKLSGVPPPKPLLNFNVDKARARPYRPFRWSYHQTMSLKKMEPDYWLELESTYKERIAQRKALHAKHGKMIIDALPGSELACRELMEMAIQFLCVRYPKQFHSDGRVLYNRILNTQSNVDEEDPLVVLNNNVPEDFLLTLPDPKTGLYTMVAGVCCSSLGWNVATKIGKPLKEIHDVVPDYKEKMEFSMDRSVFFFTGNFFLSSYSRYFSKMPTDKPIQRGSWGLEIGQPLWLQDGDPHFAVRTTQDPNLKIEDIYLRVDWQTLRRLPRSRSIVFNFKALFTPFSSFRNEPYIPHLVLKVLTEGKKKLMEYKGTWHIEHKVIPALEEWCKEQEEKGWVPEKWEVRTLDEDPYYPGWKKTL
ncbi:hypothetical protein EV368DRAFT_70671 [Lentinula lateritia]|uniref:Uncharacterized protein n=1 Tax=Lentinula aff. lateritia TaxID=2804960 RepID=A0ACC1UG59_9AGAR|nr:hypothetical protein F5876DRAFT_85575 [Lentinula aff. lateritia]KAJ3857905.1 hypothetical protein EV368DRAFT_70671 [Lentinula lateritia]